MLKATWLLIYLALAFQNGKMLFRVGRWGKVFEDMLGDPAKLPQITKVFLAWANTGGGLVAPSVLGAVTAGGVLCVVLIRNLRVAAITGGVFALALLIHAAIARLATWSPFQEVITGLTSGV